jgi:hypothetical protein
VKRILFDKRQTVKGAKRLLRKMRERWVERMMRPQGTGDDREWAILGAWCNQTDNYWPGLFHCYADPRIPGTNNSLELFIKQMKQMVRLISRNPNPATRVIGQAATNAIAVTHPELPGKEFLASRSAAVMQQAESSLKGRRRKLGAALRIRRDVDGFVKSVQERWKEACAERCAAGSSHG